MALTSKDIKTLIAAIRDSGYRQVRVRTQDFQFELDRQPNRSGAMDARHEGQVARDDAVADPLVREGLVAIVAPMSGTFYRAPDPDSPPFVEAGSRVGESDIVCIVEVMKLFSSIRAGCNGQVAEICAENGASVRAGEALYWIKPD